MIELFLKKKSIRAFFNMGCLEGEFGDGKVQGAELF